MNNVPRQQLCALIQEQGTDICRNPKRCRAFLKDYCGQYQREIFLLTKAIEQKIPEELARHKENPKLPLSALLTCLKNRLQDAYAVAEEAALWTVKSWALALAVIEDEADGQNTLTEEGRKRKDAHSFYKLGNQYYYGQGVNQDRQEAIKWYRRAAELNLNSGTALELEELENRLFFSVLVGKTELVDNLLQLGVDPNVQDKKGRTPLIYSILANQQKMVERLLQAGADLTIVDDSGHTALHWAIMLGEKQVVKLLLETGADIEQPDKDGNRAWEIAVNYDQLAIKELLQESKN